MFLPATVELERNNKVSCVFTLAFIHFIISVVIQSSGGLSKDQIENMIREAEKHAAEDAERKELIEAINQAESVIHDTDTKITEYADQINADEAKVIKEEIENLRKKLADKDNLKADEVRELIGQLQNKSLKLFEAAYKKMAEQNNANNQNASSEPPKEEKKEEQK